MKRVDLNEAVEGMNVSSAVSVQKEYFHTVPRDTAFREWCKECGRYEWKPWAQVVGILLLISIVCFIVIAPIVYFTTAPNREPSTAYASGDLFYTSRGNVIDMDDIRSISKDCMSYYVEFSGGRRHDDYWEVSLPDGERLLEAWKEYKR